MDYTNTEKISNILNKTKAYIEIGRALKIEIDPETTIGQGSGGSNVDTGNLH